MGYESLSTVVVLVIVVIIMAGWLPTRTVKGMRKVAEHREDRYSSSLHLVDKDSGTRFSDERTPPAKGIIMQSDHTRGAKYSSEHIARVRHLRRAAIRRRRIIVITLLAITVLVLGISFPLKFSPLFALIPAALLAVVLALGARAASQAREWERKVAAANGRRSGAKKAAATSGAAGVPAAAEPPHEVGAAAPQAPRVDSRADAAAKPDDPATDVMEQREIRRVLRQAREEQVQALAERDRRKDEAVAVQQPEVSVAADHSAEEQSNVADATAPDTANEPHGAADGAVVVKSDPAAPAAAQDQPSAAAQAPDETSELAHVKPSRAMDAVDMASSQDLISFSLGAPRNGVDVAPEAPESLEIKSMRQVAKAVPVESPATADESPRMNDTAAFHAAEVERDVEAPAATDESLGNGLEAILARRSS